MKKIITIFLLLILSFGTTFAYNDKELETKKNAYIKVLKTKLSSKLEKVSESKLKRILILVDKYILKYKNNKSLSDYKKLKKIALLKAFKEIISEKLENEFSDIDDILSEVNKKIEVLMISDKRCGADCNTAPIIAQLKQIPSLSNIDIKTIDYSTKEAKDIMTKNEITLLPAAVFSNNSTTELTQYLKLTKDNKYTLAIGSTFDPTAKMSDKGFKILDKKTLENVKSNSYIKGNKNAKISWIEYSDLECPFCAKLHNQGTSVDLEKKYGDKLNEVFQNFPLSFHKNAFIGAEILECLGKEKGTDAYYQLKHITYKEKNSDKDFLINEAVKLGANKETITKCVENKTFTDKINNQQKLGSKIFGVTGTPGIILINNETGEYKLISGAYPTTTFEEVIDKLLK